MLYALTLFSPSLLNSSNRLVSPGGKQVTFMTLRTSITGILSDDTVVKMDDRSLFTMLSMVKGIGSWSVHMFMIFSLYRPDVLPVSDLGVRKGVKMLYGLEELPRPSQMEQLCVKWRPYQSIGAWYMWRFIEGKGTPTTAAVVMEGGYVQPLQTGGTTTSIATSGVYQWHWQPRGLRLVPMIEVLMLETM